MTPTAITFAARTGALLALLLCAAPAARAQGLFDFLTRTYAGQWHNTTFDSTGDATIGFEVTGSDVAMTVDMDGFVFGMMDPDPVVLSGTIVGDQIQIDDTVMTYGQVDATVGSDGSIAYTLTMIPAGFMEISGTGTVSASAFDLTYDIDAGNMQMFHGVVSLPEPGAGVCGAAALAALLVPAARRRAQGARAVSSSRCRARIARA